MSLETFNQIKSKLDTTNVSYEASHHEPTRTSEIAARVRGVEMKAGAKAIVVRGKKTGQHWLLVMPADLKLDSKRVKEILGERVSFAKDLEEVTGCEPGSVPPFGSVIGLKTYLDPRLAENETIYFNAGTLTDSIAMRYEDYVAIEKPEIIEFSKE